MSSKTETIYLDHAATSWPKPGGVRERLVRFLDEVAANAGRGGHWAALESARMVFEVRERLAGMLNVPRSEDLVFTRGTTEGLNLVLKGLLKPGELVLVSPLEHNSVMRPLEQLALERRVRIKALPADQFGRLDLDAARVLGAEEPPRLVAVSHASNVNGAVQDLAGLRRSFPDSALLVDAAQTVGVLPIDVAREGVDFLACSAHKALLGPTGLGVCYLNPDYEVRPLIEGGTGSRSEQTLQPEFRPDRYEAGTLNLHGIAGLGGALEHIATAGLLGEHKRRLSAMLITGLEEVAGLELQSPRDGTALMVSFRVEGLSPDQVAAGLEERGILCRPGLQCAPAAHRHLGTFPQGTVRLSPGFGNTERDVARAVEAVRDLAPPGHR